MLSKKAKKSKRSQLLNYIDDIDNIAEYMETTVYSEVRAMQLESIKLRVEKAKALIDELC